MSIALVQAKTADSGSSFLNSFTFTPAVVSPGDFLLLSIAEGADHAFVGGQGSVVAAVGDGGGGCAHRLSVLQEAPRRPLIPVVRHAVLPVATSTLSTPCTAVGAAGPEGTCQVRQAICDF